MKRIFLSAFLLVYIFLLTAEVVVSIGNGNINNNQLPVYGEGLNSFTQFIYLQSELNIADCQITKVSFYYNGNWAFNTVNNWELFLGHTEQSYFSELDITQWIPMENFQLVFTGILPLRNVAEWIEIELDTPFVYNNVDNLAVSVQKRTFTGSAQPTFRSSTSSPTNRGMVSRSAFNFETSTFPDPWFRNSNMPNVILVFESITEPLISVNDFIPPLHNQSLQVFATVENVTGVFSVKLTYWVNENETDKETLNMIFQNDVWTASIPPDVNLDGNRICFKISVDQTTDPDVALRSIYSSLTHKYFAGTTLISEIRLFHEDNTAKYNGYITRVKGIALNNQGAFSDRTDNDFAIQNGDSGIRILGGLSINATQGNSYQIIGKIIEDVNKLLYIYPTSDIQDLGYELAPKPFLETVLHFTTPETAKYHESRLIGISNLRLAWGNFWSPPTITNPVRTTLMDDDFRVIPLISIPSTIGQYPADMHFDLVGILGRDDNGFHILIRSSDDFYPTGVLNITLSSFTVNATTDATVQIKWTTESEMNMSGFHLLKNQSNNLENATQITNSIIPAHNNSNVQNYTFVDSNVTINKEYFYWLKAVEYNGTIMHYGPVSITIHENIVDLPTRTLIGNVYPNPMLGNSIAHCDVSVKENETAILKIFNIRGQLILEYNEISEGNHIVTWDGRDKYQQIVPAGVYFFQFNSPSFFGVKRMVFKK